MEYKFRDIEKKWQEWWKVNKETAKKEWVKTGGEDFTEFIDNSLLPTSIDFKLKAEFMDSAQLVAIKADISKFPAVDEVKYPTAVVEKMASNFRLVSIGLLIIAIIISAVVIILIDNTIRLAMFSNRFLIKNHANGGSYAMVYCQTA